MNNSFKSFAEERNKFRLSLKQNKIDVACDSLQAQFTWLDKNNFEKKIYLSVFYIKSDNIFQSSIL